MQLFRTGLVRPPPPPLALPPCSCPETALILGRRLVKCSSLHAYMLHRQFRIASFRIMETPLHQEIHERECSLSMTTQILLGLFVNVCVLYRPQRRDQMVIAQAKVAHSNQ